jgi:hypothetical protein
MIASLELFIDMRNNGILNPNPETSTAKSKKTVKRKNDLVERKDRVFTEDGKEIL